MILEVGKGGKVRLIWGIKKTNVFECGDNGMVVEREKGIVTLYATNAECSKIYARLVLGTTKEMKKYNMVALAYSKDKMLLDGGDLMVIVDYAAQIIAVNKPELKVVGSSHWGQDVQAPWKPAYNVIFGLPAGEDLGMDREAAEAFWQWFEENEEEIADKVSDDCEDARGLVGKHLCAVFPYEKETEIEFQLGHDEGVKALFVYHLNKEQLKADVEELGEMMPESLRENWHYITEA